MQKIPQRFLEDAFWELDNDRNEEIFADCLEVTKSKANARELYIVVRAKHFINLEHKQKKQQYFDILKTEEIWNEMKKQENK